jgi:hypothetical protein
MPERLVPINLSIPEDLRVELKMYAAKNNTSMQAVIVELLRKKLK